MQAFYVTMRNGSRTAWLLGPFNSEQEAREMLPAARTKAIEIDPYNHFHAFGTASIEIDTGRTAPYGCLNTYFDTMEKRYAALTLAGVTTKPGEIIVEVPSLR
jgi:hypothetical protein